MKRFEVGKQYRIWPLEKSADAPRIEAICFRIDEDDDCWFAIINAEDEPLRENAPFLWNAITMLAQSHYDKRCGQ